MKLLLLLSLFFFTNIAIPSLEPRERVLTQAIEILEELEEAPDSFLFTSLLKKAEGIAIFPEVKRVGVVVGASFGEGFMLREDENGRFFGPAFLKMEGLSIGPQLGVQSQGLVLLLMNRAGIEAFYQDGVTLGGNVSVTAGPIGRSFSAGIDTDFSSSIYSYAISRGLFVGLSLEGVHVKADRRANERFFGKKLSLQEILTSHPAQDALTQKLVRLIKKLQEKGEEL